MRSLSIAPLTTQDRPVIDHFAKEMGFAPSFMDAVKPRLTDVALRVATMDKAGMAAMLISLAEPGAQGFTSDETDRAADFSRRANEFVKEAYCDAYPGRFFGMATVPSGDGEAAAKELEYAVKQLGFVGCLCVRTTPPSLIGAGSTATPTTPSRRGTTSTSTRPSCAPSGRRFRSSTVRRRPFWLR